MSIYEPIHELGHTAAFRHLYNVEHTHYSCYEFGYSLTTASTRSQSDDIHRRANLTEPRLTPFAALFHDHLANLSCTSNAFSIRSTTWTSTYRLFIFHLISTTSKTQ
ncbi:hypothetical protein NDA11_001835 [Ustilago hordei]|uniref:Uncharacterized protein n=1 Tax=Ustilago hordei TaxID=120017 RepID=I2FMU3_USTHO|nr:hypothetical protein NDA10_001352 [Ustilago hordei]KAJ1575500.1 hypothetical protein NDA15_004599 [Ustilago hordei]KAJ1577298.1 hypothetical protein NDA12_005109 [Ustilago hordei]KAJ1595095.1 hypothetical protein NDA11_001835 [Ustilago hordei]KAJ1597170.1 hypothetical protein NDA14_007814 [Ustilago hordei]